MKFFIDSEVKPLKSVLVNVPDPSLDRLNPSNYRELLLEDMVSYKNIANEFNVFIDILKAYNIEIFYFKKLFQEVLENPAAKAWLLNSLLNRFSCDKGLLKDMKAYLNDLGPKELCLAIISGLHKKNLPFKNDAISFQLLKNNDFIFSPLPNQIYVRDLFVLLYDFVVFGVMSRKVRINEAYNMQVIYKFHPLFQKNNLKVCYGNYESKQYDDAYQYCIEGGDLMMVNEYIAIFAASQRTDIFALEIIIKKLLEETKLKSVVIIETKNIKKVKRHLDTILFFIDTDKVALYLDVLRFSQVFVVSLKDDKSFNIIEKENLILALESLLGFRLTVIPITEEVFARERSLLSIKPGVVISYAGLKFNDILKYYGVEVLEFECQEFLKLNGATYGMTCPVLRY